MGGTWAARADVLIGNARGWYPSLSLPPSMSTLAYLDKIEPFSSPLKSTLDIWDWFGNHGAFIGGAPMCKGSNEDGLTDPARTPFERLYVAAAHTKPFLALRLRPHAAHDGRFSDAMEIIVRRNNMNDTTHGLYLYTLAEDPNDPPEPCCEISELDLLAANIDTLECWVGSPMVNNPGAGLPANLRDYADPRFAHMNRNERVSRAIRARLQARAHAAPEGRSNVPDDCPQVHGVGMAEEEDEHSHHQD